MKKIIEAFAYKLCSTEVKMLIDKLEHHKDNMGLTVLSKNLTPSHGYLHIVNTGKFTVPERVALAIKMGEIHRAATKLSIVETIFEGEQKQKSYTERQPTTRARDLNPQEQRVLASGLLKKSYEETL